MIRMSRESAKARRDDIMRGAIEIIDDIITDIKDN